MTGARLCVASYIPASRPANNKNGAPPGAPFPILSDDPRRRSCLRDSVCPFPLLYAFSRAFLTASVSAGTTSNRSPTIP